VSLAIISSLAIAAAGRLRVKSIRTSTAVAEAAAVTPVYQ
jgi:hypothetical protein